MRFLLLVFAAAFACPTAAQTLDKVRKTGVITLGYIDGAAPFSYADANGEPQGYSVDLCRAAADAIATQLKRSSLKTRWVKLTIQNRIDAVRRGQVDIECGTTTWTLARQRLVDSAWSPSSTVAAFSPRSMRRWRASTISAASASR